MRNLKDKVIINNKTKGITLIALVITVIVLLILAGVSISMLTGDNGIITRASEAGLSTEMSSYKEALELYKTEKYVENTNFIEETLVAGKNNLSYNTQKEDEKENGSIKNIIPEISDEYLEKLEVIKGELLINTQDESEIKVAKKLGIEVNPYDITEEGELLSTYGNLKLVADGNGSLTLPDKVVTIGEGAFANVEGLKTIIIPSTVKRIEKNAFANNKELETVIMQEKISNGIAEGVETIGEDAFKECSNLKNIQFPQNSLKDIKNEAFLGCSNLEKIEIPKNITTIKGYTFYNCTNLKEIKLPENLTNIQERAFSSCLHLETITIPEKVTTIEENTFADCKKLSNIIVNTNKYIYTSGILMSNTENPTIVFISDEILSKGNTFSIPENIKNFNININSYGNIEILNIPEKLESIGDANNFPASIKTVNVDTNNKNFKVLNNCLYDYEMKELKMCYTKETEVELYDKVEKINIAAFKFATNLKNIKLPETVTTIEQQIFSDLKKVEKIYIGKNVAHISPLFCYVNYNVNVEINSENPYYKIENNVMYDVRDEDDLTLVTVINRIQGEFRIDEKVKIIGKNAFHNQNQMTSVYIPNGVKKIETSFQYCSALTQINIPKSVENIDKECFNNSPNLVKIIIDKPQFNENGEVSIAGSPWGCIYGDKAVEWK